TCRPAIEERLKNFGSQRNNLQKLLLTQLAGYRTENAGPYRLARFVDQHGSVCIEANISSIAAARFLAGAHYNCLYYFTLFHLTIRRGFLHRCRNHVTETGLLAACATQRQNHLQLA